MIKIKEYPPVISIKTIIADDLVGAKTYSTVKKRLFELEIELFRFDMVKTIDLFNALLPKKDLPQEVILNETSPFKLPRL